MPHRAARCSWARQPDPHSVKRTQGKRERGTGAPLLLVVVSVSCVFRFLGGLLFGVSLEWSVCLT